MRIKPEDTITLIIDYQEKLIPVMSDKDELLNNSTILINGLKTLGIPLVITEQYKKGLGSTESEILKAATNEVISDNEGIQLKEFTSYKPSKFEKITFSCVDNKEISNYLKQQGKKNIILCGIEAHICVLQTAIDLKELGYQVILVTDCIDSRKKEDKKIALKRASYEGILLTTYEAILFELTRKAGNEVFKKISKLIK